MATRLELVDGELRLNGTTIADLRPELLAENSLRNALRLAIERLNEAERRSMYCQHDDE